MSLARFSFINSINALSGFLMCSFLGLRETVHLIKMIINRNARCLIARTISIVLRQLAGAVWRRSVALVGPWSCWRGACLRLSALLLHFELLLHKCELNSVLFWCFTCCAAAKLFAKAATAVLAGGTWKLAVITASGLCHRAAILQKICLEARIISQTKPTQPP